MYLGLRYTDYVKRSKVKVTQADDTISPVPMEAILPTLVTDVFTLVDMLIRFCGEKVKGQGHSRQ